MIQTGLEAFHWRPSDPSCQILAKVPTGHFSLPQESTYVGLLLSTITIGSYFYVVCCAYFFLTEQQLYSSQVHLKDSHLYYYQNISDFNKENLVKFNFIYTIMFISKFFYIYVCIYTYVYIHKYMCVYKIFIECLQCAIH